VQRNYKYFVGWLLLKLIINEPNYKNELAYENYFLLLTTVHSLKMDLPANKKLKVMHVIF